MTQEEIDEIKKERKQERDRLYRTTERYKEVSRRYNASEAGKERSRRAWEKEKKRINEDPEYREKVNDRKRRHPGNTKRGPIFLTTRRQRNRIECMYEAGHRVSNIAKEIGEPYANVYYYVKTHLKDI